MTALVASLGFLNPPSIKAEQGDILWSFGASSGSEKIGYRETAYVALGANGNNHVYVVGDDLRVHAIATTGGSAGDQVWVSDTTDWGFLNSQATTSPAVDADGVIWFGAYNDNNNKFTLYALDPADGDVLWSTDNTDIAGEYSQFVGAPAIDGNQFVYAAMSHSILAVSPTGSPYEPRWLYETDEFATGFGYLITSAPILGLDSVASSTTNQFLVFPECEFHPVNGYGGGRIHALTVTSTSSTATKSDEWSWEFPDYANEERAMADTGYAAGLAMGHDGTIYVGSNLGYFYALDPEDAMNRVIWDVNLGSAVTGSPVVGADGTIYVGVINGTFYALDPSDGSTLWSHDVGNAIESAPLIGADGAIYVFNIDGSYDCLSADVNAGSRVLWSETFSSGYVKGSHPAMDDDGVIYACLGSSGVSTGQLKAIEGFGRPGMTPWPMHGRNARRSGKYRAPYTITDLGKYNNYTGAEMIPMWVNNSSLVVGHAYYGYTGLDVALSWSAGSISSLGTMSGFSQDHYAVSVNSAGTSTGWAEYFTNYYAPHYSAAFRRTSGGTWTQLAPLHEYDTVKHVGYAEPEAINDDGVVVGKSKNNYGGGVYRATRWNSGSSTAENLASLEGTDESYYSYATYVNQDGYIVGGSETGYTGNPIHAFFMASEEDEMSAANDLGTPTADDEDNSFAVGINDHGIILIYSYDAYYNTTAYFKLPSSTVGGIEHTKDQDFVEIAAPGTPDTILMTSLNNLNQAVGYYYASYPATVSIVPMHLNFTAPLDNLIPPGSGWSMWSVHHLNDKGEIVGTAKLSGTTKGVILNPQD